jgi:hypothetical protein
MKPDAGQFDDVGFLIFGALTAVGRTMRQGKRDWPDFAYSEGGNTEKHRSRDT